MMPVQSQLPLFGSPESSIHPWSVSELTGYIKEVLEFDPQLREVWVEGEISNLTQAASGHLYFTLKDEEAAVRCVMWRSAAQRQAWRPEHGAAALARGRITVYPPRGSYQLQVEELHRAGLGDLHTRFEELREQLKAEGLFDAERKRPLPRFPQVLAVVTSPQAAALRDVLNVLHRRFPLVQVLLAPASVQGDRAPAQIVAALQALDARDDVDLILLVRGGGSLEELWAFNDERVARAVASCRHPVISGVGHETDYSISDFVADLRAPTPSAAAELAVPDRAELGLRIDVWVGQLVSEMERRLDRMRQEVWERQGTLQRLSPLTRVESYRQQVDDLTRRATQTLTHNLDLHRSRLAGLQARLAALSPLGTLERGYAIVRHADGGDVVRSVEQIRAGNALAIRVQDGEFGAVVESGYETQAQDPVNE